MPSKPNGFMAFVAYMKKMLEKDCGRPMSIAEAVHQCDSLWKNLTADERKRFKNHKNPAAAAAFAANGRGRGNISRPSHSQKTGVERNEERRIHSANLKYVREADSLMEKRYPIRCDTDEEYDVKLVNDLQEAQATFRALLGDEYSDCNKEQLVTAPLVVLTAVPWLHHPDSEVCLLAEVGAVRFSVGGGFAAEKSWLLDIHQYPSIEEVERVRQFPDLPLPTADDVRDQLTVVSLQTFRDELLAFGGNCAWLHLPSRRDYNLLQGALQHVKQTIGDAVDISDAHFAAENSSPLDDDLDVDFPSVSTIHRQRLMNMLAPLYWLKREAHVVRRQKTDGTEETESSSDYPAQPTADIVQALFDVERFLLQSERGEDDGVGVRLCAYHRHIGGRVRVRPADCAAAQARLCAAFFYQQLQQDYANELEDQDDYDPERLRYDALKWTCGHENAILDDDEEKGEVGDGAEAATVDMLLDDDDDVSLPPLHSDDEQEENLRSTETTPQVDLAADNLENQGAAAANTEDDVTQSLLLRAVKLESCGTRLPVSQQLLLDKRNRMEQQYVDLWDGPYPDETEGGYSRFVAQLAHYTGTEELCDELYSACYKRLNERCVDEHMAKVDRKELAAEEEQRQRNQKKYADREERARRRRKNDRRRGVNMDGYSDLDYSTDDEEESPVGAVGGGYVPTQSYGDERFIAELTKKKREHDQAVARGDIVVKEEELPAEVHAVKFWEMGRNLPPDDEMVAQQNHLVPAVYTSPMSLPPTSNLNTTVRSPRGRGRGVLQLANGASYGAGALYNILPPPANTTPPGKEGASMQNVNLVNAKIVKAMLEDEQILELFNRNHPQLFLEYLSLPIDE